MEQWLVDLISSVPLAIAILIVFWQMANRNTAREQERDVQQAELEKQREIARLAAQAAHDRQMEKMLELQSGQQALQSKTNEALEKMTFALQALNLQSQEQLVEMKKVLAPVATEVPVIKADVQALTRAVQNLEKGQEAILKAILVLSQNGNATPEALLTLTHEVSELKVQTIELRKLIPKQVADLARKKGLMQADEPQPIE